MSDLLDQIQFTDVLKLKNFPKAARSRAADPDEEKMDRVMAAMMKMDKIEIEPIQKAADGR